jgi:hypothetical protein
MPRVRQDLLVLFTGSPTLREGESAAASERELDSAMDLLCGPRKLPARIVSFPAEEFSRFLLVPSSRTVCRKSCRSKENIRTWDRYSFPESRASGIA